MKVWWELWDTESGNMLGDWATLTEAFEAMMETASSSGAPGLVIGRGLSDTPADTLSAEKVREVMG